MSFYVYEETHMLSMRYSGASSRSVGTGSVGLSDAGDRLSLNAEDLWVDAIGHSLFIIL